MSPAEREREVAAMVRLGASIPDPVFHGRLFAALVDLGLDDLLLRLPPPSPKDVEMFLRTAGGYQDLVHHQYSQVSASRPGTGMWYATRGCWVHPQAPQGGMRTRCTTSAPR